LIGVTGRIQTRNYENQQEQRVYVTEVVAESFQMLESRNSQQQSGQDNSSQNDNSQPFGNSNPMDISDDDLPF
ncbi:TPA: single-stranded DNA-binding protein, partial [Streptococcus pyogenes]|nr:single-stranded DNA-binding protein [Streptococcus pyogenes]